MKVTETGKTTVFVPGRNPQLSDLDKHTFAAELPCMEVKHEPCVTCRSRIFVERMGVKS